MKSESLERRRFGIKKSPSIERRKESLRERERTSEKKHLRVIETQDATKNGEGKRHQAYVTQSIIVQDDMPHDIY